MAERIRIEEFDEKWIDNYRTEANRIKAVLGKNCVSVHHVGSTAVKGMLSNPVIDIIVVVRDFVMLDLILGRLASLGYRHVKEYDSERRYFLIKGDNKRTHHIQLYEAGNRVDIQRHLAVRDYLQNHPQDVKDFNNLKISLIQEHFGDAEEYYKGKENFHRQLEQKALYWKSQQNHISMYLSFGLAVGMALGVTVGAAFDNVGIGMCMGMAIGVCVGLVLSSVKRDI